MDQLQLAEAYDIHINSKSVSCKNCSCTITPENIYVAAFLQKLACGYYGKDLELREEVTVCDGQYMWMSLTSKISELIKSYGPSGHADPYQQRSLCTHLRQKYNEIISTAQRRLINLSLDLVLGMYRQLLFVNKICVNFRYWNDERVIRASITRYFKFI